MAADPIFMPKRGNSIQVSVLDRDTAHSTNHNQNHNVYSHNHTTRAGHSGTLVRIADQLSDSPFFWFIAFCALPSVCLCPGSLGGISMLHETVQRHIDCSFHHFFDPLPSGLRVLEQRAEYVPSATHQVCLAKLRLQFLRSF
uniref:Uncharacterized protein n=1 Tax=Solanum tuberosum TaxID=4113 RepID=M1DV73_SOLTU